MRILSLGCGRKISDHPDVLSTDWSMHFRMRNSRLFSTRVPLLLSKVRRGRIKRLSPNIMAYNLSKGIPSPDNSADVDFNSNVLEHLDRNIAEDFLLAVLRVIKPGGVHRIAVPDFESTCAAHLAVVARCDVDALEAEQHQKYAARILEQSFHRKAAGTQLVSPVRRRIESLFLGDARSRGVTNQWMYGSIRLGALLPKLGYRSVRSCILSSSEVPGWADLGLDTNADGT